MAGNEFLDRTGVATLWERMRQYVYECCCSRGGGVTYRLESDGNEVTLVGSDGSRSTVEVEATAVCEER